MHTTATLNGHWSRLALAITLVLVTQLSFSGAAGAAPQPPRKAPEVARGVRPTGPNTISPATAAQLAAAMGVPPADLLAADLMGSDPAGAGVSNASLGQWFPTQGGTFAILSTGRAMSATLPNSESDLTTVLGLLNNNQGNDLVRLHLQLAVPAGVDCAAFDFAFYSEEFPEYVGSIYNDVFTAQLGDPTLTVSGTQAIAPGNFALDTLGNVISVNTVFGVSGPTGTTYDGVTPLLRASAVVTPSTTIDLYFSIQDLGDDYYDSAVFLDRFLWTHDTHCHAGTVAAFRLYLPLVRK
jgi:hypothetical protein